VPDLPRHGKSIDEGPLSLAGCADEIAAIIKKKAAGAKAHVVGHSLGAKIIVELLAGHPETVDHAVIVSGLYRPIPGMKLMFNRPTYKLSALMMKSKAIRRFQVNQFGFTDAQDKSDLDYDFSTMNAAALEEIYGQLYEHLVLPDVSAASAPSLVIAGDKEYKAMQESVCDIAGVLQNGKGIMFKNSRHDIPWAAAEDFNLTVKQWISDEPLTSQRVIDV